ncbi:MAG: hypothetical protein LWX83_03370 [Anaerolineae bacterium]|nr:hypothetical protein [Anaerolineae bacterium]
MKSFNKCLSLGFWLTAAEGLLTFCWILALPSEAASAVFMGLSRQRLILAAMTMLLVMGCVIVGLLLRLKSSRLIPIIDKLINNLNEQNNLTFIIITSGGIFFILIWIFINLQQFPANYAWLYATLGEGVLPLYTVGIRLLPLLTWAALIVVQSLAFLVFVFFNTLRQPQAWPIKKILASLAVFLLVLATFVHWLILIFQLQVFSLIPGWFWGFSNKPFTAPLILAFAGMLLMLLAVTWLVIKWPFPAMVMLVIIFLAGWAMQLGLGLAEGRGLDSLRERFFSTMHKSYALSACGKNESLTEIVSNYENTYGLKFFPGTKPPGVILSYALIERGLNAINPLTDTNARCERLGQSIAWLFPPLTFLIIFVLFILVNKIGGAPSSETRFLAPLLVISTPAYILFALFLDEALYPFVFLSGICLLVLTIRSRSFWPALISGCFLYLAIFFSFTMLPLFAFAGFYWIVEFWQNRDGKNLKQDGRKILAGLAGFGLMHLLFTHFLNYDFWVRYQNAMQGLFDVSYYSKPGSLKVGEIMSLTDRVRLLGMAAGLNNLEFATSIGLPFYALFVTQAFRQIKLFFQRKLTPLQIITFACFLTFILLNLISQTRSESARLWLFWVPVAAIFAGLELEKFSKNRSWLLYIYSAAQWVSLFLLYVFQELK